MLHTDKGFELCERRKAILATDGHLLVLGGPGSGKTTIALAKGRERIRTGLLPGQRILFLSFSNPAIQQISSRAGSLLSKQDREKIDILTYHAFCWSIIRSHGYLVGSSKNISLIPTHDVAVLKLGHDEGSWAIEERRLFTKESRATFDIFAPITAEIFECSVQLRKIYADAYPLIIVDEFQDTSDYEWLIINSLAMFTTVMALADPEQRIYAFRKGSSINRIEDFKHALTPICIDLGLQNNRSKTTDIPLFGEAVNVHGAVLPWGNSVKRVLYQSTIQGRLGVMLKFQLIELFQQIKDIHKIKSPTIAILTRGNNLAIRLSEELNDSHTANKRLLKPIQHELIFDKEAIALAGRVIACLLQMARGSLDEEEILIALLHHISDVHASLETKGGAEVAGKMRQWATVLRNGNIPRCNPIKDLKKLIEHVRGTDFTGDPVTDWILVRDFLGDSKSKEVKRVFELIQRLRLFRKGADIEMRLGALWRDFGSYQGAVDAFDKAITMDQLLNGNSLPTGISIMNIYKSKGKEFDAIVLVEHPHYGRFIWKNEEPPYTDLRRVLRVAITRARFEVRVMIPKDSEGIF